MFANGLQIRHYLTGMAEIRQPVNNGNGAIFRQHFDLLLFKGTNHDAVQHTRKHARRILCRFTPSNLGISGTDKKRVPAQLVHARFKGNARPCGGFLENHAERLPFQKMMLLAFFDILLQPVS